MARRDVAAVCAEVREATDTPFVYLRWPKGSTPTWPCIEYHLESDANFGADGGVYRKADRWALSLYSESKADAIEEAIEDALDARSIRWSKNEFAVESEGLIQVEYTFGLYR